MTQQILNPHYHGPALGTGIANDIVAVTPSDTDEQFGAGGKQDVAIGLYVGGAGTLVLQTGAGGDEAGDRRTITVPANTFLPVSVRRVYAASTATDITAFLVRQER